MNKLIAIALLSVLSSSAAYAASPCKGLEQPACESMVFENVPVCRWQGQYFTTNGERGNYCTTSGKKITDAEQFARLQAELPNLLNQAIAGNTPPTTTGN